MENICKSKLTTEFFNFDEHKTLYTHTKEEAESLVRHWNKNGIKLDVAYILKESKMEKENSNIDWVTDSETNIRFFTCNMTRMEVW